MPEFNTFDLGRAYSQAQNIKESRQMMDYRAAQMAEIGKPDELRNLQIETARIANKKAREPKQPTFDERMDNLKLLNVAAAGIEDDPSTADGWLPQLQQAGIVGPESSAEALRTHAKSIREKTGKTLERIKALSDDPKTSAFLQEFIDLGGDPNDKAAVNKFYDRKQRAEQSSSGGPVSWQRKTRVYQDSSGKTMAQDYDYNPRNNQTRPAMDDQGKPVPPYEKPKYDPWGDFSEEGDGTQAAPKPGASPPGATGQNTSGEFVGRSKSGKPMTYRNGQWEYD